MKKTTLFIGMLSMIAIVSCKKKEETPTVQETTTIEMNTPAPVIEEDPDGTSISVGKEGVDISTKNGSNETNVNVGGGDAKVEVKK